jgi:hypothetical protein
MSRFDLREQFRACGLNIIGRRAGGQIGIDVQKANGRDFGLFRLRMSLAERLHFVGVEINAVSLAVGFGQPSQRGGLSGICLREALANYRAIAGWMNSAQMRLISRQADGESDGLRQVRFDVDHR